jgi:Fic family protein
LGLAIRHRTVASDGDIRALQNIEQRIDAEIERLSDIGAASEKIRRQVEAIDKAVATGRAKLVEWLGTDRGIHPVLVAGIAQFQLVHVHPFVDGNGRTSRLLSTLCLYRAGYDFKRLFTLSDYYDRDRSRFYKAIQGVRNAGMDLTGWIEFFVEGFATQLAEVKARGERAIRRDILVRKHRLNLRQGRALEHLWEHGNLDIRTFESLCPKTSRRTLQRDLAGLETRGLIRHEGETNNLVYLPLGNS